MFKPIEVLHLVEGEDEEVGGLSEKEKGLMDMDDRVVTAGSTKW